MTERRVCFSEDIRTIPCTRRKCDKQQWISTQQLLRISKQVHVDAKECGRDETTVGLSAVFDISVQERIDYLVHLNQKIQNVRGLERHVCREHRDNLLLIQKGSIQAVLHAQTEGRRSGLDKADYMQQRLAQVSQERSHKARVYARLLAMADHQVAKKLAIEEEERKPRSKSASYGHSRPSITQLMKWSSSSAVLSRMSWSSSSSNSNSSTKQQIARALSSIPGVLNDSDKNAATTTNPAA